MRDLDPELLRRLLAEERVEIRWAGRGGQGAKTSALLLAGLGARAGLYVQGFPEYGPERMGAPVAAYNRLSRRPIFVRGGIRFPHVAVILEREAFPDRFSLASGGFFLAEGRTAGWSQNGRPVFSLPAAEISRRWLGRELPGVCFSGALFALLGLGMEGAEEFFRDRFADEEVARGNYRAFREGYALAARFFSPAGAGDRR